MHVLTDEEMHKHFVFDSTVPKDKEIIKILFARSTLDTTYKEVVLPSFVDGKQLYLPNDCGCLFSGIKCCEYIDLSNIIDTSNVFSLLSMFMFSKSLRYIEFGSDFNTSNVISMDRIFYGCENLEALDISNFDLSNLQFTDMMFYRCFSLKEILLPVLDKLDMTKRGTKYMFYTAKGQRPIQEIEQETLERMSQDIEDSEDFKAGVVDYNTSIMNNVVAINF